MRVFVLLATITILFSVFEFFRSGDPSVFFFVVFWAILVVVSRG